MELIISGWKPGLKTISLMDILRKYGNRGLKQAKQDVDGLLVGKNIHLSISDDEMAIKVREEIEILGGITNS